MQFIDIEAETYNNIPKEVERAIHPGNTHIYAQYTIRPKNRDSVAEALKAANIPSDVYYRKPLHQQAVFGALPCSQKSFLQTEKASQEVISLPFHPYLTEADQDRIIAAVIKHESK